MKNTIKKTVSNPIQALFRKLFISEWKGNFSSWQEACKKATGYNDDTILDTVTTALMKVKNGEAAYERDSVLFDKIEYSWPTLSALMWIAAVNKGELDVIDFGGSLGSSYFQNKFFLDSLKQVRWNIVEQENFVTRGKGKFQDETLKFYYSIDECINSSGMPNVVMLSCVLPYLQEPYDLLAGISNFSVPYLIIDNTPFNTVSSDRICIQKVPDSIYKASIPCWLLNYEKVVQQISDRYHLVAEYENESFIYVNNRKLTYRGIIAKLKTA